MLFLTRLGLACLLAYTPQLLGGCSNSDESRVTINAWLPVPLEPGMLRVKADDGNTVWNLTGVDFHLVSGPQYRGPTLQTANHGTLTVSYVFLPLGSGATVSAGAVELPLRRDWGYGVDIRPDTADPRLLCFGCVGSKAFPLAQEFRSFRAESVYVVWGGNSIRHPVIY